MVDYAAHILSAECFINAAVSSERGCPIGCCRIASTFQSPVSALDSRCDTTSEFRLMLTHLLSNKLSAGSLKSILHILEIRFNEQDNQCILHLRLQRFNGSEGFDFQQAEQDRKLSELRSAWPTLLSAHSKKKLVENFQDHTSSQMLKRTTRQYLAEI